MACCCPSCFNTSCPEPVAVTILQTFLSLADGEAVVALEEHKGVTGLSVSLDYPPLAGYAVKVLVNGLLQSADVHYTMGGDNGEVVTFANALSGDDVQVEYAHLAP